MNFNVIRLLGDLSNRLYCYITLQVPNITGIAKLFLSLMTAEGEVNASV
jgi:hypothetical protein